MPSTRRSNTLRQLFFWLLIIAFLWVLINRFAEIEQFINTLSQGIWVWVLAAAVLQVIYYILYATLFQSTYILIDINRRVRDLLPIVFASLFINSTTPSVGTAGLALFVDDARQRGESSTRVTVAMVLVQAAMYGVFAVLLVVGLIILISRNDLTKLEAVSATIMFTVVALLFGVLAMGLKQPDVLQRFLFGVQRTVNRVGRWVKRPFLIKPEWAEGTSRDFTAAAAAIAGQPRQLMRTLLVAIGVHLVNLLSLGCLFLAFRQPLNPEVLAVGYAMSILFMIVSPTPNGIGVVETILPLIYASMGVPASAGTIITIAFRGLSFWLPMFVGFVLLRRLAIFRGPEKALAEAGQVRLAAILTATMGIINVLSAIVPTLPEPVAQVAQYSPLLIQQGGNVTAVLAGFALLLLARGLWRHKRAAWYVTICALLLTVFSHLLKGDTIEAGLAAALVFYLWTQRSHFHALSDMPTVRQVGRVLLAALTFTLVYGLAGFYILDNFYSIPFSLRGALEQTLQTFTVVYAQDIGTQPGLLSYFSISIYLVGAATLGYALLMLLRPVLVRSPASAADRRRAQPIVTQYGRSSFAYLTLYPDKSYYFSPGGSVIAYTTRRGTAVALGDPIGPEEDLLPTLTGFWEHCRLHDWQPAFYQTGVQTLPLYLEAGFHAQQIGQETSLDFSTPALFNQPGETMRKTRNQLLRQGYHTQIYTPPHPKDLLEVLRLISDEWLTYNHSEEKKFLLPWFTTPQLQQEMIIVSYTPGEYASAFATMVPIPATQAVSLGLLRYRRQIKRGTLEMLFTDLLEWAQSAGYKCCYLGMDVLPLEDQPGATEASFRQRVLATAYDPINRAHDLSGLQQIKQAFPLIDRPRYLIYTSSANLPGVWTTLARASGVSNIWWDVLQSVKARWLKRNGKRPFSITNHHE